MLNDKLGEHFKAGNTAEHALCKQAIERNNQAYFLFLFAAFEKQVEDAAEKLVDKRRQTGNWPDDRVWEQAHERLDRMDLMKLVELLLPKGQKDCSRIFELKKQRDNIAHGDQWDASKVIWSTVAPEFNGFVSRFETN